MGICTSRPEDPASKTSFLIDQEIKIQKHNIYNHIKMLLLGPGESGKSTIFKQMKINQEKSPGFSHEECLAFKPVVHANCISQMKVLIVNVFNFQVAFSSMEARDAAERLLKLYQEGASMSQEIAGLITLLWSDKGIQTIYEMRGRKYQLNDTAEYFFTNVDRISQEEYVPTEEDILRARVRSTGIEEAQFSFEQLVFTVVDVGGQRAERRKWIHCFNNVHVVLFCAALSAYDQNLREDSSQNRMIEALILFEEVVNSAHFQSKPIILFLNKTDLFEAKYTRETLTQYFIEYTGATVEDGKQFLKQKFLEKLPAKPPFVHFTCALNTRIMRNVILTVRSEIMKIDIAIALPF